MSEDTKQPGSEEPAKPDASVSDSSGAQTSPTPPPVGTPSVSDAEKAAIVEQAKARVQAAKDSIASSAPPADAPKAPVKKKEEGPKPVDASGHPLVQKLKDQFGAAIGDASEFVGQLSVNVDGASIVAVCDFLKQDEKTPFDYLSDLTCVHYPDRTATPFEVVYNLYSI